jgi:hypothetical protein
MLSEPCLFHDCMSQAVLRTSDVYIMSLDSSRIVCRSNKMPVYVTCCHIYQFLVKKKEIGIFDSCALLWLKYKNYILMVMSFAQTQKKSVPGKLIFLS